MMKKKKGTFMMLLGLLFILSALSLTCYNIYEEWRGEQEAGQVLEVLVEEQTQQVEEEPEEDVPDYIKYPDMQMPTVHIDGYDYIGTLTIPVLDLELPIMDTWDAKRLKVTPCRYTGSVYSKDLVIAGHNYKRHFSRIKSLIEGDELVFEDVEGNVFRYEVRETEILGPTQIEEMSVSEWDMSLFTCTYGGRTRYTVRCMMIE